MKNKTMRRLPIYLLLPVASHMVGEPIERVNNGLHTMRTILMRSWMATELAWISVISFGSDVRQIAPLTEIEQFQPPILQAGGGNSFGNALRLVTNCAKTEVRRNMYGENDYRPMVFIMTDGLPTDDYISGIAEFKSYKWGSVIACGYGSHPTIEILSELSQKVVVLDNTDGWWTEKISTFFQWVSHTISATCDNDDIPQPPPEISVV